jgi:hypothetical protein
MAEQVAVKQLLLEITHLPEDNGRLLAILKECIEAGLTTEARLLSPETTDMQLARLGLMPPDIKEVRSIRERRGIVGMVVDDVSRPDTMDMVVERLRRGAGGALQELWSEIGTRQTSSDLLDIGELARLEFVEEVQPLLWSSEELLRYCLSKCAREYMGSGACLTILGMEEEEFTKRFDSASSLPSAGKFKSKSSTMYAVGNALVLCVPPGRDVTRLYYLVHKRVSDVLGFKMQFQVACHDIAYSRGFEQLAEHVRGAVVCVGAVHLVDEPVIQGELTSQGSPLELGDWTVRNFRIASHENVRFVFLGYRRSYWGDLAAKLGDGLCRLGPAAILHVGSNVGVVFDKNAVRRALVVPNTLSLLDSRGHGIDVAVDMPNVLHAHAGLVDVVDGQHHSLPSPLDLTVELVEGFKRAPGRNWRSVDCEGAYFAQACFKHKVPFGAAYVGSDLLSSFVEYKDLVSVSETERIVEQQALQRIKEIVYRYGCELAAPKPEPSQGFFASYFPSWFGSKK